MSNNGKENKTKKKKEPTWRPHGHRPANIDHIVTPSVLTKASGSFYDITPLERIIVAKFIRYNGSISKIQEDVHITRDKIHRTLRRVHVRKKLRKLMKIVGLDLITTIGTVREIMMKKGDYHMDFNRLRAADISLKLWKAYGPKKVDHRVSGEVSGMNPSEVRAIIIQIAGNLKSYEKEKKEVIEVESK